MSNPEPRFARSSPSPLLARLKMLTVALRRSRLAFALVALLIVVVAGLGVSVAYISPRASGDHITLTALQQMASSSQIVSATFRDEDARIVVRTNTGQRAWTAYPSNGSLTAALEQSLQNGGATVNVDQQPAVARVRFLAQFVLPVLLLVDLFALLIAGSRGGTGGVGDVVEFGSLARSQVQDAPVRFTDVGGAHEAVTELAEVRDYLREPERYRRLGAAPPKGVLLFGPPGTGKTLLAKAVAGEAGVPFFSVGGAHFVESLVGVGAARVRDLFARVRAVAPAIVFIDELDAVGRRRGTGAATGGTDERENTLNQLLVEMDGFDVGAGIVVIAATNRPDILDPALTRPGRFDRHVVVERPDLHGRLEILQIHARSKPLGAGVDLNEIAHRTPGFTGADLANVVNDAALLSVREDSSEITQPRLIESIDRVLAGPRRRGRLLSADELRETAVHEAGHAIVAAATGAAGGMHRVTVLPRGRAFATTATTEDDGIRSSAALTKRLVQMLSGIAAERLLLGDVSTAGEDDLTEATALARAMVARYGMSERVGPVRLASDDGLDAPNGISAGAHERIDAEVARILTDARTQAERILRANASVTEQLVSALMSEETVEGASLEAFLSRVKPAPRRPAKQTR